LDVVDPEGMSKWNLALRRVTPEDWQLVMGLAK
jgi:hypothetical protein